MKAKKKVVERLIRVLEMRTKSKDVMDMQLISSQKKLTSVTECFGKQDLISKVHCCWIW